MLNTLLHKPLIHKGFRMTSCNLSEFVSKNIEVVNKSQQTMVGELSEDGKWRWDGTDWKPVEIENSSSELDISSVSNQLMMNFPGKSITPISPFELKMDSSICYRSVIRFMHDNEGKYYSRNRLFSLSLNTIRWGPLIIIIVLSFSIVLAIPCFFLICFDWLSTHRKFGKKLDDYLTSQGFTQRG